MLNILLPSNRPSRPILNISETSVEEAIIEMYLAGVSTRRIEDVSEILWGAGVSIASEKTLLWLSIRVI